MLVLVFSYEWDVDVFRKFDYWNRFGVRFGLNILWVVGLFSMFVRYLIFIVIEVVLNWEFSREKGSGFILLVIVFCGFIWMILMFIIGGFFIECSSVIRE